MPRPIQQINLRLPAGFFIEGIKRTLVIFFRLKSMSIIPV
jgi:hypothetical protein